MEQSLRSAAGLAVSAQRISERLTAFSQYNDTPGNGVTRFSFGENDKKARQYLLSICEKLGLSVSVDPVGNLRARYQGTDPTLAPLWVGSHMDSVRNGGMYDGLVGVVGALEAVSVLSENGIVPSRSIDVVVFAEEEGSNFGTTMVGSKCLAGKLDLAGLERLRAEDGRSCAQVMRDFGLRPEAVASCYLTPGQVHAMMELHIEQGIVLDRKQVKLGIVQAIAGMITVRITVSGESNHAGSTPMDLRHDPLVSAAKLICRVQKIAETQCTPDTVATVGEIVCAPNMPNVIPGQVAFTVDIRDVDENGMETALALLKQTMEEVSVADGVTMTLDMIGRSKPVVMSGRVREAIAASIHERGVSCMEMNSGAVHDTAMLAPLTDVGMIFVPSVNGKSHNPEEYTPLEDIALGCQALLDTVARLTLE